MHVCGQTTQTMCEYLSEMALEMVLYARCVTPMIFLDYNNNCGKIYI